MTECFLRPRGRGRCGGDVKSMRLWMLVVVMLLAACNSSVSGPTSAVDGATPDVLVVTDVTSGSDVEVLDRPLSMDAFDGAQPSDAPECSSGASCDDGVACTDDTCVAGRCQHLPLAARCADGIACTDDLCDVSGCTHVPVPARCMTGQLCDPRVGCQGGRVCAGNADCSDTDPCTIRESCDPVTRVCRTDTLDGDHDGHPPRVCGGDDCDDSRDRVHPDASELCNGTDDDCDGVVDEGATCGGVGQACLAGNCRCAPSTPSQCSSCGSVGCFDLQSNAQHCGGCCTNCGSSGACVAGSCRCAPGATRCDGAGCVDLQADPNHCGACARACASGMTCDLGACRCPGNLLLCGGACVNAQTENANCGACGNSCPSGATCVAGSCQCASGRVLCGGRCVNTQDDASNCGACGRVCMGDYDAGVVPQRCVAGQCRCEGGMTCPTPSGTRCINVNSDPANCGRCGNVCSAGAFCAAGVCTCPAWTTSCGTTCADLFRDDLNCGRCGTACTGTDWCDRGTCRPTFASAPCERLDTCGGSPLTCFGDGICSASCTPSGSAEEEARQCGGSARTVTCITWSNRGAVCARRCTTADAMGGSAGPCAAGFVCTSWGSTDTPGCFPFCRTDGDCRDGVYPHCNPRGFCGADAFAPTARPDGEPCYEFDRVPCRGFCAHITSRADGICSSYINLAVTANCPDTPSVITPARVAGDDRARCTFRQCTRSSECTLPLRCIYPEQDGRIVTTARPICTYPTTLQPTGL